MLRTWSKSSDSDEEQECKRAYFVRALMEQPISIEKVNMPYVDEKSDFGIKFIPRTMNLIAYSYGNQEQIKMDIAKSQRLCTGYKELAAAIIASGKYQVLQMG